MKKAARLDERDRLSMGEEAALARRSVGLSSGGDGTGPEGPAQRHGPMNATVKHRVAAWDPAPSEMLDGP